MFKNQNMEVNKFPHDKTFNDQFDKIKDLRFYPYVGKNFISAEKRILVFAHNVPVKKIDYEAKLLSTKERDHFVNDFTNYSYLHDGWTSAFRKFLKGSLSFKEEYTENPSSDISNKIDDFVIKIAFANYIYELVCSDSMINVIVPDEFKSKSNAINHEIINILEITHIVCWGKHVYGYLLNHEAVKICKGERWNNFESKIGLKNRKGFEYSKIEIDGRQIHVLKIFHPSMPGFGVYNESTHKIMDWFYRL